MGFIAIYHDITELVGACREAEAVGYRADVAANGLEAIDAIARQTYDVVLMDVQMPATR